MEKRISDFIDGNVTYDSEGQYFWVNAPNGGLKMLAELRGWGAIQNLFKTKGKYDLDSAAVFQDHLGEFIAEAINEKMQKLLPSNLAIDKNK